MPKRPKKTYYWDACAFIAWLDGGKGHPVEVIAGLDEIAKEVTENRANLCTSVIIDTEMLKGKLTPDQVIKIESLFKRKNVVKINLDSRIATKASEIRDYYNGQNIKISLPDSIHLATAIIYNVDEFDTLDGAGNRPRRNDLLPLNGDVAGHPLLVRVPHGQPLLFTSVQEKADEEGKA
jgi:predicted nucleic acid-binding protein